MTQPNLPDADAQQQMAVDVFAQYEPPLYEAYLDMMLEWLAAVKTAMFAGGVVKLGLVPDPFTVFSQGPKWAALTDQYTEQVAREVLAAPYKDLFADGTLFESRPFVRTWIAERANRLQKVPDEVFGLVTHIVDSATTNGASIPDVQEQIEQLFSDTGVEKWKNRARTVARTEVVGAYNGGLHDAFSMLVDADPDTEYVKRWLATEDQRTRPDHREADGQTVPWGQPFIVGGFAMMHPHDPDAPAKEVVNCRCVELLEHAGEPTSMKNRQYLSLAAAVFGFNPLEKRGRDGRWTKDGSLPGLPKLIGLPEDWTRENPDPRYKSAANGEEALAQFKNIDSLPSPQRSSLAYYSDEGFYDLNRGLGRAAKRGEAPNTYLNSVDEEALKHLDQATAPETRSKDVTLWRGMYGGPDKFGADAWNGNMTGTEWTQKGFGSTSADFGVAAGFNRKIMNPILARVLLPKEVKVGGINMVGKANKNRHEAEVMLGRGVRYRVTADHGYNKQGERVLDLEVVQ